MKTKSFLILLILASLLLLPTTGCGLIRLEPDESEKQNAWLHYHTLQAADQLANRQPLDEPSIQQLQSLTQAALAQSQAIVTGYGLPRQLPAAETTGDLAGPPAAQLAQQAQQSALQTRDPFAVADKFMDLLLGLAGLTGGVLATRLTSAINLARQKSRALREIIANNELFKHQHPDMSAPFKQAQTTQSPGTQRLVTEIRSTL